MSSSKDDGDDVDAKDDDGSDSPTATTTSKTAAPTAAVSTSNASTASASASTAKNGSKPGGGPAARGGQSVRQALQFPWKLHEVLAAAAQSGQESVISWLPGGRGFKVHNKEIFCRHIMPSYFNSNKYKTFQVMF